MYMSLVDSATIISPIAKGTKRAAPPPTNGTVRVTRSKAAQCETAEVPALVKIFDEAEALPDPDATDADYEPVAPAEEEPEEETNEQCDAGDVVDDERPPFADADPKPADPALVAEMAAAGAATEEYRGEQDDDYRPANDDEEGEPAEEYEEGDVEEEQEEGAQ